MPASLLTLFLFVPAGFAQECEPYYETSINARRGYAPAYMITVPDIPGDQLPGGVYASAFLTAPRDILRWDGEQWASQFSYPLMGIVAGMFLHDEDGDGPLPRAIYVGTSDRIFRYDGEVVEDVTNGLTISSMVAIGTWDEDGPGERPPALFVHAVSFSLNGTTFKGVARWNGLEWTPMPFPSFWPSVIPPIFPGRFLGFDPDGAGPEEERLYLGAFFYGPHNGGLIARWMDTGWELVGGGFYQGEFLGIYDMKIFDNDGDGPLQPKLLVASDSAPADGSGGPFLNAWDGTSWSGFPEYRGTYPHAIENFDLDGPGPLGEKLYIADEAFRLHTFDGETFVNQGTVFGERPPFALHATTMNGSPALICSGPFNAAFRAPVTGFAAIIGCPRTCPMDIDENGVVDLQDLSILLANFGANGGVSHENGDLDADEDVDVQDLTLMLADYGMRCM